MDSVDRVLVRASGWVVGAFAIQSIVGTVVAFEVIDTMRHAGLFREALATYEPAWTLAWTAAGLFVVLLTLLWLFARLRQVRPWARTVLLVVAWISILSAAVSLAGAPLSGAALERVVPGAILVELRSFAWLDALSNVLALTSWGYLIWVLQFREDVRVAFCRGGPPAAPLTHASR